MEQLVKRRGLTEVFSPAGGSNVDVVFVHGINGHASGTWTSEKDRTFWPAQLLPPFLEEARARVLVYGYDADTHSPMEETSDMLALDRDGLQYGTPHGVTQDKIHNHAEQLIQSLCANRRTHAAEHPIVFVAHSLGGIVVKRALIHSAGIRGEKTARLRSITISTYGILFLGTPHLGLNAAKWTEWSHEVIRTTLGDGLQTQLLEALKPNSETLQNIDRHFIELTKPLHIFYFHEMQPTKLGNSSRYVVEEVSAAPTGEDVDRAGIEQDHIHMCKFDNEDSPGFALVSDAIQRYATDAPEPIRRRWALDSKQRQLTLSNDVSSLIGQLSTSDPTMQLSGSLSTGNSTSMITTNPPKSQLKKHYLVPWDRVKHFVGRDSQLEAIAAYFTDSSEHPPQVLVLHALGGQGKSQIILEYCQRWRKHYRGVFWVNATSRTLALQSYARIATALSNEPQAKFEDGEQIVQIVRDLLEDWHEPWLLVFDNLDKPDGFGDIRQFFPRGESGQVIITTRRRDLDRLGDLMELGALSVDDGVNLLLRHCNRQEIERNLDIAKEIIQRLGGLALAIDQAGAYIAHRRIPADELRGFLEAYETQRKKIMSYTPRNLWDYGLMQTLEVEDQTKAINAFTTWEISMKALVSDHPLEKDAIIRFLTLSAYFNPARIEESLFRNYWETLRNTECGPPERKSSRIQESHATNGVPWLCAIGTATDLDNQSAPHHGLSDQWDTGRFWDLLMELHNLSLVQNIDKDTQGAFFSFHPLVRDWLQHRGRTVDHSQSIAEGFAILESTANIHNDDYSRVNIDQRNAFVSHIDACLLSEESLCEPETRIGNTKTSYGVADKLALSYYMCGRHDSAEILLRRIAKDEDAPIRYFAYIFEVLNAQGKSGEVVKLSHRCRQYRDQTLDRGDQAQLAFRSELSTAFVYLKRYDEAEPLLRQTLRLRQEILGKVHWQTMGSMTDLADLLSRQGEYQDSEALARETLALCEANLPKDNPITLRAMGVIARALRCQRQFHAAEPIQRQVVQTLQRLRGMEHPSTLAIMHNLAWILETTKIDEAEELYRYVIQTQKRVLRKGHPDTLDSMECLADLLRDNGRDEEADAIKRKFADIKKAT
ncbi:MAG: hypothetical protein Q9168_001903 [Polycauliona sp. 1 TL-2023]